ARRAMIALRRPLGRDAMSMTESFRGRVALVTGAGIGIGRAVALALAAEGAAVGVHCHRSIGEAEQVVSAIKGGGGRAWLLQTDLADPHQAAALTGRLVELAGRLDVLINNAGSPVRRSCIEDCELELWQQILSVNLTSVFLVTRSAIPHLRAHGQGA